VWMSLGEWSAEDGCCPRQEGSSSDALSRWVRHRQNS
jgi:hypothetical protein